MAVLGFISIGSVWAQDWSNSRSRIITISSDTIVLDSLSIVPESFILSNGRDTLTTKSYELMAGESKLIWKEEVLPDSLHISYRVFPVYFPQRYSKRSTDMIQSEELYRKNPFTFRPVETQEDPFAMQGLNKTGSISRGIGFGNNQDLTVNSTMSLQLSGKLNENISIAASVTDDNIPIQPEGNTAQIQEFDQVYIQLYNENSKLTVGDFILDRPVGYFMNYYKRAQGATFSTTQRLREEYYSNSDTLAPIVLRAEASGALSKGKFARNIIKGVEGNQGPYLLEGNENESFIIVLAGTERVFIDGRLLQRGQENDYVIDYNTAELTFTAKQLITKDKRITVEFQYSDANYVRSLMQASTGVSNGKFEAYLNVYSEQDAKNQSLQNLDDADKMLLSQVGDSLNDALAPSFQAVSEFSNDQVFYTLVDTLGYDSVFVVSNNEASNHYTVSFSNVGEGNGDYIKEGFSAIGRVFTWVAPDTVNGNIQHRGNYLPVQKLIAPKKSQMAVAGGNYKFSDKTKIGFESAFTNTDLNTFSNLHASDNSSYALMLQGEHIASLQTNNENPLQLISNFKIESLGDNFSPIQPYRNTEFYRDWNLPLSGIMSKQTVTSTRLLLEKKEDYNIGYGLNTFYTSDFSGIKNDVTAAANYDGLDMLFSGSLLNTKGHTNSQFVRHKSLVEKDVWITRVGYADEREDNRLYTSGTDSLTSGSYKFFDWQAYFTNQDSSKVGYKIFYRNRTDYAITKNDYATATDAVNYGGELALVNNPSHQFKASVSERILNIKNADLTTEEPEKTLLSRIEHNFFLPKGILSSNIYYELGSGLERENEFLYIQDPTGQGQYTWIDYNSNNQKELNEFEIARPEDGDRYIRIYTVTDQFIKAYTNQYSHSLNLNPAGAWRTKEGVLKFLSRFSNQTAFRIERKTKRESGAERFNPFKTAIGDSSLISQSTSIRNTFFFNRSNSKFGLDYTYGNQFAKTPLTGGFEERNSESHLFRIRWNLSSEYAVVSENEVGVNSRASDIIAGTSYKIDYYELKQTFSYQPGTNFRISLINTYTVKENAKDLGAQAAELIDLGLDFRLNKIESGSIISGFNMILIDYSGDTYDSVSYEMLDGLNNGKNFTWTAGMQRNLGNNLQLTLSYNGRKSEETKSVHTGNVQVRAFF